MVEISDKEYQELRSRKKELEAAESKFRTIFETSIDMISYVDRHGKILDINNSVENLLGYKKDEVVGRNFTELGVLSLENLPRIFKLFTDTIQKGEAETKIELALKCKKGEKVYVEVGTNFIKKDGKVEGVVNIFRDITERKRMEENLKQSRDQLAQSERLASLGRIAAGVAHELNNPLTGVLGMAQLMLEETKKGDPKREELEIIEESALRCKGIIQSLLSFAQKTLPEFKKINLKDPLYQSLRLIKKQLILKDIQVETDIPPAVREIEADGGQLTQVFLNLLNNSIESVKQKGIIKIQAREDRRDNRMIFTFEDNGSGIDPEYLPHIFEPFFTTKKKEKGTGLGLSISYGIIQSHNGSIECQSRKGKGTTFTIKLPIRQSGKEKVFSCG